jgi:DNA segregation ATPase FtsK/SpoIIIE-like protein
MTTETDNTKQYDTVYADACELVRATQNTRISHLQCALGIGYNRAARLIEAMEVDGIVSHTDKHGIRKMMTPNVKLTRPPISEGTTEK